MGGASARLVHAFDVCMVISSFGILLVALVVLVAYRSLGWRAGKRVWMIISTVALFALFIALSHLLQMTHAAEGAMVFVKATTAMLTCVLFVALFWLLPAITSLPGQLGDVMWELKQLRDYVALTNAMWHASTQEEIVRTVRNKLKRMLPPNALIDVTQGVSANHVALEAGEQLLTMLVDEGIEIRLKRGQLTAAQIGWLRQMGAQMRIALQWARHMAEARTPTGADMDGSAACSSADTPNGTPPRTRTHTQRSAHMHTPAGSPLRPQPTSTPAHTQTPTLTRTVSNTATNAHSPSPESPMACRATIGYIRPQPMRSSPTHFSPIRHASSPPHTPNTPRCAPPYTHTPSPPVNDQVERLRVKCVGALSRIGALSEVVKSAPLSPQQSHCMDLITQACQVDMLEDVSLPPPTPTHETHAFVHSHSHTQSPVSPSRRAAPTISHASGFRPLTPRSSSSRPFSPKGPTQRSSLSPRPSSPSPPTTTPTVSTNTGGVAGVGGAFSPIVPATPVDTGKKRPQTPVDRWHELPLDGQDAV